MDNNKYDFLLNEIHHDFSNGVLSFLDQRMLMLHHASLANLRRELMERVGAEETRKIMMRIGYQQGIEDAKQISRKTSVDLKELFEFGPLIREMEGFAHHRAIDHLKLDENTGEFWADYAWENSWEAQAHLEHFDQSGTPACWMMTGYACGYSTFAMGRPILWKETECVAMGHSHCRVVGLPLEEEPEPDPYMAFMEVDEFISAPKSRHTPTGMSGADLDPVLNLPDMVGVSRKFLDAVSLCKKVSGTSTTVLVLGESGVGKERFARAIHAISASADGPFISVNCAAIPKELVESELFGVEKGAFTGAVCSRKGKFERAQGGTLFLDEIGCLPFEAQGKLLRAIQERVIERVGGDDTIKVDFRLIAATNSRLEQDVVDGSFREDLYYRLNVFPVEVPPLRERSDDIPLLVNLFISRFSKTVGKSINGVSRKAFDRLLDYAWPGNVRELENVCERAVILAEDGGYIDVEHLNLSNRMGYRAEEPVRMVQPSPEQAWDILMEQEMSFADFEEALLSRALERNEGNMSAAARMLGIKRGQFEYKFKKRCE